MQRAQKLLKKTMHNVLRSQERKSHPEIIWEEGKTVDENTDEISEDGDSMLLETVVSTYKSTRHYCPEDKHQQEMCKFSVNDVCQLFSD
jgi:hypothetical protein